MPRKPRMTLEERRKLRAERLAKKNAALPPDQREHPQMPQPDGQIHVPKIMSPDPLIFPPKLRLTLQHYLNTDPRDATKAATLAGMDPAEFRKHLKSPGVYQWLQKQEDLIERETAREIAKARMLNVQFLDQYLVTAVKVAAKLGDSKPIELGYDRVGIRRDKNFMTVEQANPQSRPQTYRVLEQTVTRTEQVTQREITTTEPAALPCTTQPRDVKVLDY